MPEVIKLKHTHRHLYFRKRSVWSVSHFSEARSMIIEPLLDISFIITDFISVYYILNLSDGLRCYSVWFLIFCILGCFWHLKEPFWLGRENAPPRANQFLGKQRPSWGHAFDRQTNWSRAIPPQWSPHTPGGNIPALVIPEPVPDN